MDPPAQDPTTSEAPARIERLVAVMGTSLSMEIEAADRGAALAASEAAVRAIEAAEQRLSTWRPESELSQLNAAGARSISAPLAAELGQALGWARLTGGAFDPTVGPLVEAYGLRSGGRRPSAEELAAALARVGHQRLKLDGDLASLAPGTQLEEGAFGKGAGLDAARAALVGAGARGTLSLGGQVLRIGGSGPALLPLAHPDRRGEAVCEVELGPNESMATSACGVRPLEAPTEAPPESDGTQLSHILDPRSGLPAPAFGSVTVIAPSALTADALSTAAFVLGPEAALEQAARWPGVEVLVLTRASAGAGLALTHTPGLDGRVHRISPSATSPAPGEPAAGESKR